MYPLAAIHMCSAEQMFWKTHRKIPAVECFSQWYCWFKSSASFLWIIQNFSEHLFSKNPSAYFFYFLYVLKLEKPLLDSIQTTYYNFKEKGSTNWFNYQNWKTISTNVKLIRIKIFDIKMKKKFHPQKYQ